MAAEWLPALGANSSKPRTRMYQACLGRGPDRLKAPSVRVTGSSRASDIQQRPVVGSGGAPDLNRRHPCSSGSHETTSRRDQSTAGRLPQCEGRGHESPLLRHPRTPVHLARRFACAAPLANTSGWSGTGGDRGGQVLPRHPHRVENHRPVRRRLDGAEHHVAHRHQLVRVQVASAIAITTSPDSRRAVATSSTTTVARASSAPGSSRASGSWEPAATTSVRARTAPPADGRRPAPENAPRPTPRAGRRRSRPRARLPAARHPAPPSAPAQ